MWTGDERQDTLFHINFVTYKSLNSEREGRRNKTAPVFILPNFRREITNWGPMNNLLFPHLYTHTHTHAWEHVDGLDLTEHKKIWSTTKMWKVKMCYACFLYAIMDFMFRCFGKHFSWWHFAVSPQGLDVRFCLNFAPFNCV